MPPKTGICISFFGRPIYLLYLLWKGAMEAAGIEPASEDIQREASTCLSSFASRSKAPEEERHSRTSSDINSLIEAQNKPDSLSCSTTPLKRCRKTQEKRHAYLLGSNWQRFCTSSSPPFFEVVGPRHASSASLSPSNPIRPQTLRLNYILHIQTLSIFGESQSKITLEIIS